MSQEVFSLYTPNGHIKMPVVGYGCWKSSGDELKTGLEEALKIGYRHIDSAAAYENEEIIGTILKQFIEDGNVKREDLFITTKLPPVFNRPSDVESTLNNSLQDLQLDYVDLYLVHTPFGLVGGKGHNSFDDNGNVLLDTSTDLIAVWKEMEKLVDSGKAKSIGISNFNEYQIKKILDNSRIKPSNLQIEIHLYLQQDSLVKLCKDNQITVTAYSPLGSGASHHREIDGLKIMSLFDEPKIINTAEKYQKTPAQIVLKYTLQRGIAVIPKSVTPKRIKENIELFDFQLSEEDMNNLKTLDMGEAGRVVTFEFFKGVENHPEFPFKRIHSSS